MRTRLSWSDFGSHDKFVGTEEEMKNKARKVRDDIVKRINEFINTVK